MWFSDVRLILPDRVVERGAIQIEGETITQVIEGAPPAGASDIFSAEGLTAMPGIIDLHGDMLERDIEPRPGARFPVPLALYELDKRLAAAGVTTAYASISFSWSKSDLRRQDNAQKLIYAVNAQRDELFVDHRVHGRFEIVNPDTVPILQRLLAENQIQLVSVMDHTPGQGQYRNVDKYVDFMSKWLGFDPTQVGDDLIEKVKRSIITNAAVPRDWDIVRAIAECAHKHNVPIASHDDDTEEKVSILKEMGITISEFPVTLEAAQAAKARGMHVVMGAPNAYRGVSTSEGNLSARDAMRAGAVDVLATDYFPAAPFQAALLLADQGELPLYESVRLVTQNAAEAMNLNDRGKLETGYLADIVLFDDISHHPRVRATLRRGQPIYWDSGMMRLAQQQDFRFTSNILRTESA
jgi:alpha-D-ribose 1-methylphosphonate 5-triphosphate diphosphatase